MDDYLQKSDEDYIRGKNKLIEESVYTFDNN